MRKIRIFCENLVSEDFIFLDRENTHYLIDVLRMKIGDFVEILTSNGLLYEGHLERDKGRYLIKDLIKKDLDIPKTPVINLFVGAIKGSSFDYAIEKASELGAKSITPVVCEYSSIKSISKEKINRFKKISLSSALQCRRAIPLIVNGAVRLEEILKERLEGNNIFLDPFEGNRLIPPNISFDKPFNIFSGPEGGFSQAEINRFRETGFSGLSLNTNILRAETIPLVICSIILYEYQRRV